MSQKNKNQAKQGSADQPYTLMDYIKINGIFWAFLIIVSLAVFFTTGAKMDPVMGNVFAFIFAVFGLGFTAVSIFDFIYERISGRDEKAEK